MVTRENSSLYYGEINPNNGILNALGETNIIKNMDEYASGECPLCKQENTLGIIVYKFPAKANTFIVNEMLQLIEKGINIHIYSMGDPTDEDVAVFKDALEIIGDNITYMQSGYLFRWAWMDTYNVPLAQNTSRKLVDRKSPEEIYNLEIEAIIKSKIPFNDLIIKMKKDNITKLYAPFAGLGADIALMISYHLDIKFYFSAHAYDLFDMDGYAKLKMERASHIFPISNYNKALMVREYDADPEKISVKRVNFISSDVNGEIEAYDTPDQYVFSAGRLVEMKGFEYAIRAFRRVHRQYPNLHYIIAGDGSKYEELATYIAALGLTGFIHLVGHVDNAKVISYIKGSVFTMLTSVSTGKDKEGIPTFFVESMAQGVPCIGTKYSGIPELIDHGKNGYLTEEKDVTAISEAMVDLYLSMLDTHISRDIRKSCITKVRLMYNNDENIDMLINELKEITEIKE